MEIKDLKPNTGNVDLVLEVVDKEEPRTFEKFGKSGSVCNLKVKDATGEVKMTLWNEDIESVNVGDKIHLQNGWCSEFRDELQISSGKFGKVEILDKTETTEEAKPEAAAEPTETSKEEPVEAPAEPVPELKPASELPVGFRNRWGTRCRCSARRGCRRCRRRTCTA